ncbi:MAG: hypothetical protein GX869_09520 [Candidatus Cloacimonetes bacterium]|jgi:hypothetical protein|uniref:Uncharacterized protein n=1 Tax=Candidatus Syntrophosphaera thermopropionivorans TaxID=2593015 RepID=A0AC61QKV1_9BACT|nr:hypothetical protein [Candidatus Syntrophosphaera thermopropionivorans]NLA45861.1 hypothetical protein [Candidatus Cloacimonadota bacterium]HNV92603.1 hypothetical protein [Candidatus Cloacimonas sp.]HRU47237.1 hypothetical protein [Candidatus Syntrophosphaera sp.]TDF74559.1 hypothetical protein E0946_00280 [Candidatus Syntrophosphaera thermopropionivorans]HPW24480.1 hypothetical protein [Candidatus Syntrophosphaera thermopropionivorans]
MAVTKYDVKCYGFLLDYLEKNDPADEIEVISRLSYEKEWDSIPLELKQKILEIDKIILDKYASNFNYLLWKRFIQILKSHQ